MVEWQMTKIVNVMTDHGIQKPRSDRARPDHRVSQVVSQQNPCRTTNNVILSKTNNKTFQNDNGNAILEMKRLGINILGICETRWACNGKIQNDEYTFYYSENDENRHRNGVGMILELYIKHPPSIII